MRLIVAGLVVIVWLQGCTIKEMNKTNELQTQALDLVLNGSAPHAEPR